MTTLTAAQLQATYGPMLAAGNYAGAFQAASKAGNLQDLVNNATTILQTLNPKGMSEQQFESYYTAFAPYEASLAGQQVGATASNDEQAGSMFGPAKTAAQLTQAAQNQYLTDTDTNTLLADEAAEAKIPGGSLKGPSAAQQAAAAKVTADENALKAIPGATDIHGNLNPAMLTEQGDVPDIESNRATVAADPTNTVLADWLSAGGPLELLAAAVAPEAIPELAAVAGGGTAATIAAGAAYGAGTGAAVAGASGNNVGAAAETGAITGGLGQAAKVVAPAISSATGGAVTPGEATGALKVATGAATGGALGAEEAGLGVAVGGALSETGATSAAQSALGAGLGTAASGTAGNLITSELDPLLLGSSTTGPATIANPVPSTPGGSVSTAPSGAQNTGISNPSDVTVGQGLPGDGTTSATTGTTGSLGSILSSLESSLTGNAGAIAEFGTLAGLGLSQANSATAENQTLASELENYGTPYTNEATATLAATNPGQAAAIPGETAAANTELGIAQTGFNQYASGQLTAGNSQALTDYVAQQKAQAAATLPAGSSALQSAYQQIDNNALVQQQTLLNSQFSTAQSALTQVQGTYTSLLTNALNEAGIGLGPVQTAIQQQITGDTQVAQSLNTLFSGIAQGFGTATSGNASKTTTPSVSGLSSGGASTGSVAASAAGGGTAATDLAAGQTAQDAALYDQQTSDELLNDVETGVDFQTQTAQAPDANLAGQIPIDTPQFDFSTGNPFDTSGTGP